MPLSDPEAYREYQRQYREKNRERLLAYDRERKQASNLTPEEKEAKRARWRAWYYQNQERMQQDYNTRTKKAHAKLRLDVLCAYSPNGCPECTCCGETILEFLGLDHVNGDGASHRKEIGRHSISTYRWARNNGYPPVLQVLCHNCNLAKGFYGSCPHTRGQNGAHLMSVHAQVIAQADLPAAAAAVVPETPLGESPGDYLVTQAFVIPEAALTAADATARTLTIYNRGQAGAGTTVVATLVTNLAGGNWAANDRKDFTLSAVANALNVAAGDTLELVETVASTGTARPNCEVTVRGTHR